MIPNSVKEMMCGLTPESTVECETYNSSKPTVGQILRDNLSWVMNNPLFSKEQKKAASMMAACKTPTLGTYVDYCPKCDKVVGIRYRSCNNRNCPGCQHPLQEKWIELRKNEVVEGTSYFHLIMTLPHELNSLVAENPKKLLSILFRCSAQAVIELCKHPKYLGAKPGIISVLHTWTQDLQCHYHVHMICSAGGVTPDGDYITLNSTLENHDGDDELTPFLEQNVQNSLQEEEIFELQDEPDFISEQPEEYSSSSVGGFFLPLKALTSLFRGKYMAELRSLYTKHQLSFPSELKHLEDPRDWMIFCSKLYEKHWIGYIARTFNGNGNAIDYLARYTFRTAISNGRITDYDGKTVTFLVRDNDNPGQRIPKVLDARTFISRLLQHVLPKGFTRVRFYGFLSNGQKKKQLTQIHEQLFGESYSPSPVKDLKGLNLLQHLYPEKHIGCCPHCMTPLDSYFFDSQNNKRVIIAGKNRDAPAA